MLLHSNAYAINGTFKLTETHSKPSSPPVPGFYINQTTGSLGYGVLQEEDLYGFYEFVEYGAEPILGWADRPRFDPEDFM